MSSLEQSNIRLCRDVIENEIVAERERHNNRSQKLLKRLRALQEKCPHTNLSDLGGALRYRRCKDCGYMET